MLAFLVDDLIQNKKEMEAQGIYTRNDLEGYVKPETAKLLPSIVYDVTKDTSMPQIGEFAPVCKPTEDYLQMPDSVMIEWIDNDEDC